MLAKYLVNAACGKILANSQFIRHTQKMVITTYKGLKKSFSFETKFSIDANTRKNQDEELFTLLRVDTHGNRFIVEQRMSADAAKAMELKFDQLTHHQGYYVVPQNMLAKELSRKLCD
mmetsp:Transcript_67343/g.132623  ORF Transcript_67343/g.132623 Transcript_67343/m.132623 type:complete len:118 (+) Transcript_67343:114-467(+)